MLLDDSQDVAAKLSHLPVVLLDHSNARISPRSSPVNVMDFSYDISACSDRGARRDAYE